MPQLHFSTDWETARYLSEQAQARGLTLSKYLAELVRSQVPDMWPAGCLDDVIGSCVAAPLVEPEDLPAEPVEALLLGVDEVA